MIGIRGFKDIQKGPAITSDVFHIEVTGPISLQLTVMDLPGLISVTNDTKRRTMFERSRIWFTHMWRIHKRSFWL